MELPYCSVGREVDACVEGTFGIPRGVNQPMAKKPTKCFVLLWGTFVILYNKLFFWLPQPGVAQARRLAELTPGRPSSSLLPRSFTVKCLSQGRKQVEEIEMRNLKKKKKNEEEIG